MFWVVPLYLSLVLCNSAFQMEGLSIPAWEYFASIYVLYFVTSVCWVVVHQEGMNVTISDA